MWPRSIAGIFLGLLISISLILNLVQLLPLAQDVKLLIGLLTAFVLWGGDHDLLLLQPVHRARQSQLRQSTGGIGPAERGTALRKYLTGYGDQ